MACPGTMPVPSWAIPPAVQGDAVAVTDREFRDQRVVPIGAVADPDPYEGGGRHWRRAKRDPRGYVSRRVDRVCIAGAAPNISE